MKPLPGRQTAHLALCSSAFALALFAPSAGDAQTNAWVKHVSGDWHELEWSLGVLPGASQAIQITNAGWKTVNVSAATVAAHPASLTIGSLSLDAPEGSFNTLLLDQIGTSVPLLVQSDAVVGSHARIFSLDSALNVDGSLTLNRGAIGQHGGVTTVSGELAIDGAVHLTNALLQVSHIRLSLNHDGTLLQYGGRVQAGAVSIGPGGAPPLLSDGMYLLYAGLLSTTNLEIGGGPGSGAFFRQTGGTNQSTVLRLRTMGAPARYQLTEGRLETTETDVVSGPYTPATFLQEGGAHVIQGDVSVRGDIRTGTLVSPGSYDMLGGELAAGHIRLAQYGTLTVSNGTLAADRLSFDGNNGFVRMEAVLAGGSIHVRSVDHGMLGVDFLQTGGEFRVSERFHFGGVGPYTAEGAVYRLLGGKLDAPEITLSAELLVSGGSGRVSNPERFILAADSGAVPTLILSNALETLGRLALRTPAVLRFGGARLHFADSSAESWDFTGELRIEGWNGVPAGGGFDQLVFGDSSAALTSAQLARICFVDAAGFPGTNYARILATGEVVPYGEPQPRLTVFRSGGVVALSWAGTYLLETSATLPGAFVTLTNVTSPYAVDVIGTTNAFFRLRLP